MSDRPRPAPCPGAEPSARTARGCGAQGHADAELLGALADGERRSLPRCRSPVITTARTAKSRAGARSGAASRASPSRTCSSVRKRSTGCSGPMACTVARTVPRHAASGSAVVRMRQLVPRARVLGERAGRPGRSARSASPYCRTSPTTPTIVDPGLGSSADACRESGSVRPPGPRPGQKRRAKDWLTTATRGVSGRSVRSKARPAAERNADRAEVVGADALEVRARQVARSATGGAPSMAEPAVGRGRRLVQREGARRAPPRRRPARSASRSSSRSWKRRRSSAFVYRRSSGPAATSGRVSVRKPGSICLSFHSVRSIRPAPIRSTKEIATWPTIRRLRRRSRPRRRGGPVAALLQRADRLRRAREGRDQPEDDSRSASDTPSVKRSTGAVDRDLARARREACREVHEQAAARRRRARARGAPPSSARSTLSVSSWRVSAAASGAERGAQRHLPSRGGSGARASDSRRWRRRAAARVRRSRSRTRNVGRALRVSSSVSGTGASCAGRSSRDSPSGSRAPSARRWRRGPCARRASVDAGLQPRRRPRSMPMLAVVLHHRIGAERAGGDRHVDVVVVGVARDRRQDADDGVRAVVHREHACRRPSGRRRRLASSSRGRARAPPRRPAGPRPAGTCGRGSAARRAGRRSSPRRRRSGRARAPCVRAARTTSSGTPRRPRSVRDCVRDVGDLERRERAVLDARAGRVRRAARTSRSPPPYGSDCSRTPWTTEKIAVLAPMPERERQDRRRGVARVLAQRPSAVAHVLQDRLEQHRAGRPPGPRP